MKLFPQCVSGTKESVRHSNLYRQATNDINASIQGTRAY